MTSVSGQIDYQLFADYIQMLAGRRQRCRCPFLGRNAPRRDRIGQNAQSWIRIGKLGQGDKQELMRTRVLGPERLGKVGREMAERLASLPELS